MPLLTAPSTDSEHVHFVRERGTGLHRGDVSPYYVPFRIVGLYVCVYVMCVHLYVCMCVHLYVCMCVHLYVCMCVHLYVCMCVHVYVCMCVHVCDTQD